MLTEVLLIKSLFTSVNAKPYEESTQSKFMRTPSPRKGVSTWTTSGEWIKGTPAKLRLKLTEDPQTFVAIQDEGRKSLAQRIVDRLTHVSVNAKTDDQTNESISANVRSLCKRTKLSAATIFLLKITGKLNLDYITQSARKAHENNKHFDNIIKHGRTRALEKGEDPNAKAEQLKKILVTILKSRRLQRGVFSHNGSTTYVAHRDQKNSFSLMEKGDLLGEGTYGLVYKMHNLVTGESNALKLGKKADKKSGTRNEYEILNEVHQNGHVKGIQDPPHFMVDFQDPKFNMGYVTTEYDINLNDESYLKNTPIIEKLRGLQSPFFGLHYLHDTMNMVHCDIKPANCCSDHGELQLADFGHARRKRQISYEQPLGICTPYFTSETDQRENMRITLAYCLHRVAIGKIKSPLAQAWILKSAIEHPTFKIDRPAARLYVASILLNARSQDLKAMRLSPELFKNEMDTLKKNPIAIKDKPFNFALFKLNEAQLAQLLVDGYALCKRHDVYGLAITALCIITGRKFIAPKSIQTALTELLKNPDIAKVKTELFSLLKDMLSSDETKRPSSKVAMTRYDQIVAKLA